MDDAAHLPDPFPGRSPLRASDTDRQRVAELLRTHTSAGRLTIEEFEQRVGAAYAARTVAELRPLLADLPVRVDEVLPLEPPPPSNATPLRSGPSPETLRWLVIGAGALLVLGALVAMSRGGLMLWPLLLIGIFVFGGAGGSRRRR